jgi:hypothetical protein
MILDADFLIALDTEDEDVLEKAPNWRPQTFRPRLIRFSYGP